MIHFLQPVFLYGFFLLSIPVILHFFSFKKYKKVYFSNFLFLEALQQQKKNSSRLKNWLLLLLRLLVMSCIVLAFARPYIPPREQAAISRDHSQVVIYLDNSFSMSNSGSQGSLFEEARKHIYEIVNAYPAGTTFRLLSNDPANDAPFNKEQLLASLGGVKLSPASKPLSQVFKEAEELSDGKNVSLFLISDFQRKNSDFPNIVADTNRETVCLVLKPENTNNLYIKDVRFEQPFHKKNQQERLTVTVVNTSDREFAGIPVTLTINDKKRSISQVDVPAKGESQLEINYLNTEDGFYKGAVEINDFPVTFDNKFYFSYGIRGKIHILYVWQEERNPFFGKLFSDSTVFGFTSVAAEQLSNLAMNNYHLVILDGITKVTSGLESAWEEYLINGGNLFFLPGKGSTEIQNRFLSRLQAPTFGNSDTSTIVARIETQASLFKDVFEQEDKQAVLPQARQFYPLHLTAGSEKLLTDKRDNVLLAARQFGKGNLYVSAFSYAPTNSDMVYHPLFVPQLLNMAGNINSALNNAYFLNAAKEVTVNHKEYSDKLPLLIRNEEKTYEFIPELRKNFSGDLILSNVENIREAGLYEVVQEERTIDVLAWNYDRDESSMEFIDENELSKHLPHAKVENIKTTHFDHNSELIKEIVLQDNNQYLASRFLLLAALLLLLEQWVWRKKLN